MAGVLCRCGFRRFSGLGLQALGFGDRACSGAWPRASGSGRLQATCDACEQRGVGTGRREGHADPRGGLSHAGGDLEQPQAEGGKLCAGQRLLPGDDVTDRQH